MHREIAADSDQLERFRREARAVAQLSHPHIVTVIDAGEDDGRPYIVFEFVDGRDAEGAHPPAAAASPIAEAVAYAIEIARALGAAHQRNIVHRDVKPQNVLIDQEGSRQGDGLRDRPLARRGGPDRRRARAGHDRLRLARAGPGSRRAPAQSDLYSLGIVLYEMLTGEVPFKARTRSRWR